MKWWQYMLYAISIIVGWVAAHYLSPRIKESLALKKELLATYLVPFKTWCHTLYKEITEFKERYGATNVYDNLSNTLIIIDYRELHDVLRESGKYRCKIETEDPAVAEYLRKLEDLVDDLWHSLQDRFSANFDQTEHDKWMEAIINYAQKEQFVDYIKTNSKKIHDYLNSNKEVFEKVTSYLRQQIPKW